MLTWSLYIYTTLHNIHSQDATNFAQRKHHYFLAYFQPCYLAHKFTNRIILTLSSVINYPDFSSRAIGLP
jgi:hypothetical protein